MTNTLEPIAMSITDSFVSANFQGMKPVIVLERNDPAAFQQLIDYIKENNWTQVKEILYPEHKMKKELIPYTNGDIEIQDGVVTYKGDVINNKICDHIVYLKENNLPYQNVVQFLKNLIGCDYVVFNELYLFLTSNESMPITTDGAFLAYRMVTRDYMSSHQNPDGTHNRNKIGDVVEVNRKDVDPDRRNCCSEGLHFCSREYLPKYSCGKDERTMVVKVFPQDVIAIPYDYNNAKGRCCKYEVVDEIEKEDVTTPQWEAPLYDENTIPLEEDTVIEDFLDDDDDEDEYIVSSDFYGFFDEDETVEEVDANNLTDTERKIKTIIDKQLERSSETTARKVSKSTRKPYVNVSNVIDIAKKLKYIVTVDEDSPSHTNITW